MGNVELVYDCHEAAVRMRKKSHWAVRALIKKGLLECTRTADGRVRITEGAIRRYLGLDASAPNVVALRA